MPRKETFRGLAVDGWNDVLTMALGEESHSSIAQPATDQ
jgi:hypothetical protein